MKFTKLSLKNFRNFNDSEINLDNKNIFFGLNDVGKTNALYALRFLFDNEQRKKGIVETDFYKKNINCPIEIIVTIDISDDSEDDKKIRAIMKGNLLSETELIYIKFTAIFNQENGMGDISMFWGYDIENLTEMLSKGYSFEIDKVFSVTYIDSYVDLFSLFKKNLKTFIINDEEIDKEKIDEIKKNINDLNNNISQLSGIKKFEEIIMPKYEKYKKDDLKISIKSEIAIKGFYSDLVPYLHKIDDVNDYPTAGDGRKKILTYSLYDLINENKKESKIVLYLIEEPENHLHKTLQISLSRVLFSTESYDYVFLTTHSPYIIYEIDNTNLIRIYKDREMLTPSVLYQVPDSFKKHKKILNKSLSEALFSSKVLLVEGPSEQLLFERVFQAINVNYEEEGIYILPVNGIGFEKYKTILDELKIFNAIKTDNDLRKDEQQYILLGFRRCNKLCGAKVLSEENIKYYKNEVAVKRKMFKDNVKLINSVRKDYKIFLSEVDLENDLNKILHKRLTECLNKTNPVKYLQEKKQIRMFELINLLTDEDCIKIYNGKNFEILKLFI